MNNINETDNLNKIKYSSVLYRIRCFCQLSSTQTISLYLMLFISYSFIGWLVETSYIIVVHGRFSVRGLLNYGLPLIPLFGFAGLVIIRLLMPLKKKPYLIFISAIFLTTLIELLTSLLNTYVFDRKTWDYNHIPLSLDGRIAVPVSLSWGLLVLLIFYYVEPTLRKIIIKLNPLSIMIFSWLLTAYYLICIVHSLINLL